ncbi:MAG: phospholipase D family protein [Verrucomicrobiae bacterium]
MNTVFISQKIWPTLTKASRGSRQKCAVAVAYFGAGADALLPLPKGSRLVVDASERAVASGQTCPADLMKLVTRGVAVYSVPNLHAKVFVLGRAAFIGSANVSNRSATQLVEAVVRTTDPTAVRAARQFVQDHCLHELTPTLLKRLAKLYRPPLLPGSKRGKRSTTDSSKRPTLPRLLLAQLVPEEWDERDQATHDTGFTVAKKRREHPKSFELDSFRYTGKCPHAQGDVVIQVLNEGKGKFLISPPGNVRYVRTRLDGNRRVSFVYLERPARKRRSLKSLAMKLGYGSQKRLKNEGVVRDAAFAQALLNLWTA